MDNIEIINTFYTNYNIKNYKDIFINKPAVAQSDYVVAITGSINEFKNRNEFKSKLEEKGIKVVDSVNKKTTHLINNDNTSNSSKNNKAKEIGIPIITELEAIELFLK